MEIEYSFNRVAGVGYPDEGFALYFSLSATLRRSARGFRGTV